jgi:hypothetical protein
MEDREAPQMRKYGESKMTRIMMATVRHVTSSSGLRKFQAGGFLFKRVYNGMPEYKDIRAKHGCCCLIV